MMFALQANKIANGGYSGFTKMDSQILDGLYFMSLHLDIWPMTFHIVLYVLPVDDGVIPIGRLQITGISQVGLSDYIYSW